MFTGIVETVGEVAGLKKDGSNLEIRIRSSLDEPVGIDQSISHNGACLTVTEIFRNDPEEAVEYAVVAVDETLKKTNLGALVKGDRVNLERCMKVGQRLDGHFVQGHVDTVGRVEAVREVGGSWMVEFSFPEKYANLLVDKGSVCVNGVSLTVVDAGNERFSVTIIPYTFDHTNFNMLRPGSPVNLEFDILGKYLQKIYGGVVGGRGQE